ncbi:hypothetical protein Back11_61220 [Paenibacillus baekrokdamisoli]|uniref:Uncharacterized protein n=1 Tax=Paenibacillus baekrokdamisoli TaxID=1712516 RepID=A0A3G9J0Q4_9BACL|nr:DUF6382 domain-containing protein [Paenibacillus baekrokdamisoli]MBB3072194.1 hypothetical protein [Paenibacillus baekrokdamisoli]BBH24777.1 hypothetical protein Back11_61220 [Paenibacillus baekrokdamisoli]
MNTEELRVDFSTSRGHEMIVDRDSGILREELDEVEIQMLQGQRIPKLLPIDWVDIDGKVTFRFSLSGRRMLIHRLQTQQISMLEFYSLLLTVAEALDDSQHYMLRTEGFMLSDHCLFVGESWSDVALVYMPLRGIKAVPSTGEAVLAMTVKWIGYVDQPDGVGLQRILHDLREEHVSWSRLRQTIHSLLGTIHSEDMERFSRQAAAAQIQNSNLIPFRMKESSNIELPKISEAQPNYTHWNVDKELPLVHMDSEDTEQNPSKKGWILGTMFIVIVGIIWRFLYLPSPNQTSLLISTGLTIMAVAGLLIYWKAKHGNNEVSAEDWRLGSKWNEEEDGFVPDSIPLSRAVKKPGRVIPGKMNSRDEVMVGLAGNENRTPFAARKEPEVQAPEVQAPAPEPARQMEIVASRNNNNEATVLLGKEADYSGSTNESANFWVERETEGSVEKIILQAKSFIIGRSEEGTNYVDSSSGISRAHLELTSSHGGWSAKDVGSRNGSTWNGQMMIPYKAYPLNSGDCVQLAGDKGPKYTYRTL